MYPLFRNLLFRLEAETAHYLALSSLKMIKMSGLARLVYPKTQTMPVQAMGLNFANPIGLAAGLDKNGDYIDALSTAGFGFVEIGTVTPRPQSGNPKPRLFRLPQARAIINRMGFNNLGLAYLIKQMQHVHTKTIIGINIGKNFATPVDSAVDDYLIGLREVYVHADYVAINISSPNTPGLRQLQFGDALKSLLATLKEEQAKLQQQYHHYVPMAVKVSPDLELEEVIALTQAFADYEIDAVIATNTTMVRQDLQALRYGDEAGGLSGYPLFKQSTEIVRQFRQALPKHIPIIASGGVMCGEDAAKKMAAGACLVQIYSGFIYHGPRLISDSIKAIKGVRSHVAN